MAYLCLGMAIAAEIVATTFLKLSEGFTKVIPSIFCVLAYVICYFSFSKAITRINLGVAYATWCGVGIVVTAILSYFFFQEKLSIAGMIGVCLIVAGCLLLNLFGTSHVA